ncbi:MAG: transposase [Variibacter sp.]|nr:transposase [Variibacter sp.]
MKTLRTISCQASPGSCSGTAIPLLLSCRATLEQYPIGWNHLIGYGPYTTSTPHAPERYKLRNVIERTLCRIKEFRGVATRYDKTARNFLVVVCLVSTITYWAR